MLDREPLRDVGEVAPDFTLADLVGDAPTRLSDLRGATVLLVLSSPHWDPAREELPSLYPSSDGADRPRVIDDDRAEVAHRFGVYDTTALFVVDQHGIIQWRYVLGADAAPRSAVVDATMLAVDSGDAPSTLGMTRRDFVQAGLAAAAVIAATLAPRPLRAAVRSSEAAGETIAGPTAITLNVNGRPLALEVEPRVTLLDALRERAGLTGTKKGCDHGQCGACTVHIDGRRVLSCMTLAVMVPPSAKVTTIEGLANGDSLHPMQQAFITHDGFQCGYCTSGQIMSATAMVNEPWGAGDAEVKEAMSGNICRCGAYPGIVAAVQSVRGKQEASR
jgi:xanthine dehydrogenase YagT iron-sulfur-binding subunit